MENIVIESIDIALSIAVITTALFGIVAFFLILKSAMRKTYSVDAETLATNLAQRVVSLAEKRLEKAQTFTLALSGGSLPSILEKGFSRISANTSKWKILFADERHVQRDSPDSNYAALGKLFEKLGIKPEQIIAPNPDLSLDEAAAEYDAAVRKISPIDCILLGVGPDGHTASLFPNHELLNESKRLAAGIRDSPKPPPQRVTLTYPSINAAKHIAFVCTGENKKDIIKRIMAAEDFPAGRVQGNIEWFLDTQAAALLDKSMISPFVV